MGETLPLATIHDAVLEFLRGRDDAVLYEAQAVNAYVDEPRMTQDVDVMSTRAEALAEEIRAYLNRRFHIAVRIRDVRGLTYRIYQLHKPKNRHLVDVRPVKAYPPTQVVSDVVVITPPQLIAEKVIAYHGRRHQPKAGTDWRDIACLLLTFPELKAADGEVRQRLEAMVAAGADAASLELWSQVVRKEIELPDDEMDTDESESE